VYALAFVPSAVKELTKIDKVHQKQIKTKLLLLCKDPEFLQNNIKALKSEYSGMFRLRVGTYRVIFQVKEKEIVILVLRIGHRKDVY